MKVKISEVWNKEGKQEQLAIIETSLKTAVRDVWGWIEKNRPDLSLAEGLNQHGYAAESIPEDSGEKPFVKPGCTLIGQDGNVFNLMGLASLALKKAGYPDKAKEMCSAVISCHSYDEALNKIGEFVDVT